MITQEKKPTFSPSRRTLLKYAIQSPIMAATTVETVAFTTAAVFIKAGEGLQSLRKILKAKEEFFDPLLNPPEINHSSKYAATQFDADDWKSSHIIVFGDSLAQGHLEGKQYQFNSAHFMTQLSRKIPSIFWRWTNHSWNGATSEDAAEKIKITDMKKYSDGRDMSSAPVSVVYSAGGNDVLKKIVDEAWDDAQKVLTNPTNQDAIKSLVHTVLQAIQEYKENLARVISELQNQKDTHGVNLRRVYILGVPNMAYAQKITRNDGKEFALVGRLSEFANIFSRHLNNATLTAIQGSGDVDFDILYIDAYTLLKSEHIVGMHPTEEGQKLLTYDILRRSLIDGKVLSSDLTGVYSLLEVMFQTEDIAAIQKDPRTLVGGIYSRTP